MLRYLRGDHNVLKVNGTSFQECVAPIGTDPLTSGNGVITRATPREKLYICGVEKHCKNGD